MRLLYSILLAILLLPAISSAEDPAEKARIDEIERFYRYAAKSKDRQEQVRFMQYCIPLYEKFLWQYKSGPNAAMARFHLGHAQQTLGQIDNAKRSYKEVIKRHKKGYWVGSAARQLAYLALQKEDFKTAATYFGITANNIGEESVRQNALTRQAQSLMKIGDSKSALGVFKSLAEDRSHPHREWAVFMRGYILFGEDRFAEASEAFRPLIEGAATEGYRTEALFYTGLCAAELGNGELAEENLRAVLKTPHSTPTLSDDERRKIARNKSLAQNSLMSMYFRTKDYQEVINLYRLGDFGARGKLEAKRSMHAAKSFFELDRFDQARLAFRRVDRALPNTTMAYEASYHCLLCDYHLSHPGLPQRVDVFLELYGAQKRQEPEIQLALFLKAQTLYNNADFDRAADVFNRIKATQLAEKFRPEMLYKRGFVLAETGDFNGATRSLSFFIRDFPDDPRFLDVLSIRGESYERLGDRASALSDFNKLLQDENCPAQLRAFALQRSARLLKADKKYDQMIKNYRELLSKFSNLPKDTEANANYWIGWAFYKKNENEDAISYLKKARELAPQFHSEAAGKILVLINFAAADANLMDEELSALLKIKPDKIIPKHMLAWLGARMFHDGNFKATALYLSRATDPDKVRENDKGIWRMLAKARNEISEFQPALLATKIALAIEKEPRWIADTHLDMAKAYLGLQQIDKAKKAASDGLNFKVQGPHNAGLHLIFGEVAFMQNEYEKAYEEAISTIRIAVDDPFVKPRALRLAAEAAEQLGSNEEASRYRRQLRQNFPNWKPSQELVAPPTPVAPSPPAAPVPEPVSEPVSEPAAVSPETSNAAQAQPVLAR